MSDKPYFGSKAEKRPDIDPPTSLLGPGLTRSMRLTGVDALSVGQLREFVAEMESENIPSNARVEMTRESPDRPGERTSWSLSVSWRTQS